VAWETKSIEGGSFFNPEVSASGASEAVGFVLPIASLTAGVTLITGLIILIEILMPGTILAKVW
jgi:hypothetical protein